MIGCLVKDELGRIRTGDVMAYFKVLSLRFPVGVDENREKYLSGVSVFGRDRVRDVQNEKQVVLTMRKRLSVSHSIQFRS
jgi:hypothetical protein